MPRLKKLKKLPQLDMNPMVDMAFLLVSFFMMTTTFKTESPTEVNLPASQAKIKIPEKNICIISIGEEGDFFFGLDNKFDREKVLQIIENQTEYTFDAQQKKNFSLHNSLGVPLDELASFLSLEIEKRKIYQQKGIPIDSANNELKRWIIAARIANPRLRFAINADKAVEYPYIHQCIETLRDLNINRFNLITETIVDDSNS